MSIVIPPRLSSPIDGYLRELHERYADPRGGEVAAYIPELANANPEWFGICVATADGQLYEVGDTRQEFTIQSISKPFTYGLALEDRGAEAVATKVGVEPTGDAFNSISLDPVTGSPLNPMINAGAITVASLVAGETASERFERVRAAHSRYAGRALEIDEAIYESELRTGHRNRAIGHMLRNFNVLSEDPEQTLEAYFRQCSLLVDCRDLSVMAATLANAGINPLNGERAVARDYVERILSVMTTCGMYDAAGQWVDMVGMPAKSGVAGGILAVLPGQLGIAVYSPPLDRHGNSVRGVEVCRDLSRELQLHFLRVARSSRSAIRARYNVEAVRSKRRRTAAEDEVLSDFGEHACVYELQGDLLFPSVEVVIRTVVQNDRLEVAVLDLRRVTHIGEPAERMLAQLVDDLSQSGRSIVFVAHDPPLFLRAEPGGGTFTGPAPELFTDVDIALEWCEDELIARHSAGVGAPETVALAEFALFSNLDADQLARVGAMLEPRRFEAGDYLARQGEPADGIFLLIKGEANVMLNTPDGGVLRRTTLRPGTMFGELSIIGETMRSADVVANRAGDGCLLPSAAIRTLERSHPEVSLRLLQNLLGGAYEIVARLQHEVATLASRDASVWLAAD